jgi:hypothetical protein
MIEEHFLVDSLINLMTQDNITNAALLSVGTAFTGAGVVMLQSNVWYSVALVLVGFLAFGLREVLP